MSEKMDGIRAYWDGNHLISKQAKRILCPLWFTEGLPKDNTLDGELWMGRKRFERVIALLNSNTLEDSIWKEMKYVIFDLPRSHLPYESRMKELKGMGPFASHILIIESIRCDGNGHLWKSLEEIIQNGGEGLMMNKPGSFYIGERSTDLLKVKV